jgi:DNA-binding transcriptional regulator LsrR (DeoR family)
MIYAWDKPLKAPRLDYDAEAAIVMFAAGATYNDVAMAFEVSTATICRLVSLKAPHLRGRPTGVKRIFDRKAAIAMYAAGGVTYREVGEKFGVSAVSIHNAIKRHAPHLLRKAGGLSTGGRLGAK